MTDGKISGEHIVINATNPLYEDLKNRLAALDARVAQLEKSQTNPNSNGNVG